MNPFLEHIQNIDLEDKKARKEFIQKGMDEIRCDIQHYTFEELQKYFMKQNFLLLHSAMKIEMQRRDVNCLTEYLMTKDVVLRHYRTQLNISDKEIQTAASIIRAQKRIILSFNIPEEDESL